MSRTRGLVARLRALFNPSTADHRMEEEFSFHVEMEASRLQADGMTPDEARRQALARFGGLERYRQEMREGRRLNVVHDLRDDLRYGARMLLRQRGLTTIAVLSLAIGIGANAAIFSVVNSVLLQPRHVREPDRLVQVYSGDEQQPFQTTSYPSYLDFRDRSTAFAGLAAYGMGWQFRLGGGGTEEVQKIWGEVVSGNYFDVLGVVPQLGRAFAPDEDSVPGRNPVAIIGHALWERQFGGDSGVIGRVIALNGQPLTVIGVAPPGFNGMTSGWASDVWVPVMVTGLLDPSQNGPRSANRGAKWLTIVGRLGPGMTVDRAQRDVDRIVASLRTEHPGEWSSGDETPRREYRATVLSERKTRVHPAMLAPVQALTAVLFVVVNLVLVIACMNLAGLLFARAVARRSEIAVRLALGAGRWRIIRQLLTESVLLSFTAGAAGLLLSVWAISALLASMPPLPEGIRIALDVQLDWRVVAYTMAFSTITGVLFGLVPAVRSSGSPLSSVLKDDAQAFAGQSRPSRSRRLLIVGQVAASVLLLLAAGLMLRSLEKVRPTSVGFASGRFVVAPISLDERQYDRRAAQRFFEQVSQDVAGLPGVESAVLVEGMPGGVLGRTRRGTGIEGYVPAAGESMEIDASIVGPGYFTGMGVPLVLGRDFDSRDRDGAPCVVIVNEALVSRYLGSPASALGRHLTRHSYAPDGRPSQCGIVGVVRDRAWQSLQRAPRPFFALPLLQTEARAMTLLVKTRGDPTLQVAGVRRAVRSLDAGVPVSSVEPLAQHFRASLYPFRLFGMVLAAGGLMALLLATIGIYGTVSQTVAQRRREVGIRMALGAEQADILRVVVSQGMRAVAWGLALGLVLGVALTRVLATLPLDTPLLFGVSALDATTFGLVTLLLALVALIACYVPARRAARVDPGVTLRGL